VPLRGDRSVAEISAARRRVTQLLNGKPGSLLGGNQQTSLRPKPR
jgi:hypothetical protein